MHLVGRAAVELQVAGQRDGVGAALLQRLAHVQRLQTGQLVGLLQHPRRHAQQHAAAFGGAELAPGAVERILRRGHGGVDVCRRAARDLREQRCRPRG